MEVSAASTPPRAVAAAVPRNCRRFNDDCEFMRVTEVSESWRLNFGLAPLCVAVKILLALVPSHPRTIAVRQRYYGRLASSRIRDRVADRPLLEKGSPLRQVPP